MDNSADTSTAEYAGRLTMDASNIALGKGTLQSLDLYKKNTSGTNTANKLIGENTAIGHFSLIRNTQGYRNTAIGKKTLSNNFKGANNTALGFASSYKLGKNETYATTYTTSQNAPNSDNTALGAEAQYDLLTGRANTAAGVNSMRSITSGEENTAIGMNAMFGTKAQNINGTVSATASQNTVSPTGSFNTAVGAWSLSEHVYGDYNLALGYNSCKGLRSGNYNICLGADAGKNSALLKDKFGLYIGGGYSAADLSAVTGSTRNYPVIEYTAPLLAGHTAKTVADDTYANVVYDQELLVNARKVKFQPYLGKFPVFEFDMKYGSASDGYEAGNAVKTRYGSAKFNFIDSGSSTVDNSISLSLAGEIRGTSKNKLLLIDAWNPHIQYEGSSSPLKDDYSDIYINNQLLIDFPKVSARSTETQIVNIALRKTTAEKADTQVEGVPLVLNGKFFVTYSADTPRVELNNDKGFYVNTSDNNGSFLQLKNGGGSNLYLQMSSGNHDQHFSANAEQFEALLTKDRGIQIKKTASDFIKMGIADDDSKEIKLDYWDLKVPGFAGKYQGKEPILVQSTSLVYLLGKISANIAGLSSDERLKNISGDTSVGLKELNQLEIKDFTYKQDPNKTKHVGVIAQQLQKVLPNAVFKDNDGYLRIREEHILFTAVNSIKELFKQVQELASKIVGLDKKITELEAQNKLLKEQNAAFEKRFAELEKKQAVLESKQIKLEKKQAAAK